MADSMALNAIYNQYLTTYAPKKSDTRYDTHKKSELRSITNSMAKVNKDAPLYRLESTPATYRYIVGIKEETRLLQNTIASVMGDANSNVLDGKIAYSSDEGLATVRYIGQDNDNQDNDLLDEDGSVVSKNGEIPSYKIEVESLASAQVNLGKYLPKDSIDIFPGSYSFDMNVGGQGYEFQFSIREEDNNYDVQSRISRLINNSNINLISSVEEDGEGNSSLRIESKQVGVRDDENPRVFELFDSAGSIWEGPVSYLGIDNVVREATNAYFTVNGEMAESTSNTFILDKNYEVTLRGVSSLDGLSTTIGIKPDTEAAVENVSNLIGGYNQFINAMRAYSDSEPRSDSLVREMQHIAGAYSEDMERIGIAVDDDGNLSVDEKKLGNAIAMEDMESSVSSLKQFSNAMLRKSRQVSLNPINYINKTVVEYKNPGKNFNSPYVASAYAGLMFNSYC